MTFTGQSLRRRSFFAPCVLRDEFKSNFSDEEHYGQTKINYCTFTLRPARALLRRHGAARAGRSERAHRRPIGPAAQRRRAPRAHVAARRIRRGGAFAFIVSDGEKSRYAVYGDSGISAPVVQLVPDVGNYRSADRTAIRFDRQEGRTS